MITPKELQGKEFVKAVFGGYDMESVDDFLEQIVEDYSALYKENAVLKSKLKVLVEKVEEYRNTEDSMRMTFLTAQKMGNELIAKAKEEAEALKKEARAQAQKRIEDISQKLYRERKNLEEIQKTTSDFSQKILDLYGEHISFIREASGLIIPEELGAAIKNPLKGSSDTPPVKLHAAPDPVTKAEISAAPAEAPAETQPESEPTSPLDEASELARSISDSLGDDTAFDPDMDEPWDDEGEPTTTRPRFNFDDLKFGKNLEDE